MASVWEWMDDNNLWSEFEPVVTRVIEQAWANGLPSVSVTIGSTPFSVPSHMIYFNSQVAIQIHTDIGVCRQVVYTPPSPTSNSTKGTWKYWSEDIGAYKEHDSQVSSYLDQFYLITESSKTSNMPSGIAAVHLSLGSASVLVVFASEGVQISLMSRFVRGVRRRFGPSVNRTTATSTPYSFSFSSLSSIVPSSFSPFTPPSSSPFLSSSSSPFLSSSSSPFGTYGRYGPPSSSQFLPSSSSPFQSSSSPVQYSPSPFLSSLHSSSSPFPSQPQAQSSSTGPNQSSFPQGGGGGGGPQGGGGGGGPQGGGGAGGAGGAQGGGGGGGGAQTGTLSYDPNTSFVKISPPPGTLECAVCCCALNGGEEGVGEAKGEGDAEEVIRLSKCPHLFHLTCIQQWFSRRPSCPECIHHYGKITGTQPLEGASMTVFYRRNDGNVWNLEGFPNIDVIDIYYNVPSGIQGPEHPNPGAPYRGTARRAFLPHNPVGEEILSLLKKAWERRLIFKVGQSITTGRDNCVVWGGIHHKTQMDGGPTNFGYPDETYFARVKGELHDLGVI